MPGEHVGRSADDFMREQFGDIPVITFDQPAFNAAPSLSEARVAIVTTAGLSRRGEEPWSFDSPTFRVFERGERDLLLSHVTPNSDRTGIAADLNVVYPIDRLEEMVAEGVIGDLGPRHLSFMGGVPTSLRTLVTDSGPAAARLLLEDGVDVVLLTPF